MSQELEAAIRRNLEQQQLLQDRLRQALSASEVRQQTIADHQRLLARLYQELEQLIQEMRLLQQRQSSQPPHPRRTP